MASVAAQVEPAAPCRATTYTQLFIHTKAECVEHPMFFVVKEGHGITVVTMEVVVIRLSL